MTEQEAIMRREAMAQRHDDLNSAIRTRNVSLAILGIVYALNIVDTILNHLTVDDIQLIAGNVGVKLVATQGQQALALRTEFTLP